MHSTFPCKIDPELCVFGGRTSSLMEGRTANSRVYCVIWILAPLCVYSDVLFSYFFSYYFIRDLYKCLAAGSLKAADRHTKGQTDQMGQFEICSKPYISLALVSYWMVRPFSLHAALQLQPQGNDWEAGLICPNQYGFRQWQDHCVFVFTGL